MDQPLVPEIDVHELDAALARGAFVVDVREPHELAEARIAGVVSIPLETVPDRMAELPDDQPVYLVCAVGGRSLHAAEFLRDRGVDAINVTGGTKGWIAAGKPIERG